MQHHLLERSLYLCRSLDKTSCSNVIRLTAFAQVVKCHGDTEIAQVVRSFHFQDFLVSDNWQGGRRRTQRWIFRKRHCH